jgi:hypothetical protein
MDGAREQNGFARLQHFLDIFHGPLLKPRAFASLT